MSNRTTSLLLNSSLASDADPMATPNAIGTTVLLCAMALAVGAGCLSIQKARSRYRHYAMGCAQKEGEEEHPVVISLYPAFPTKPARQEDAEKRVEEEDSAKAAPPFPDG